MQYGIRPRIYGRARVIAGVALLLAVSVASTLHAQGRTRGQETILALEAARTDAYRNLLESVKGLRVEGETTVRNLAVESSEIRTQVEGFIRGATILEESIEDDGTAKVTVELDLNRLERLLGRELIDGLSTIQVDGYGVRPTSQAAARSAPAVQPAVVGSPFAWNREPEGPAAALSTTVMVTGTAVEDPSRARSAAQARLLAERAATSDAYRRLLEYVYGISVSSVTTVRDMLLASDRLDAEVSGFIRGAEIVDVRHNPDGVAEVDVSLDLNGLQRFLDPQ